MLHGITQWRNGNQTEVRGPNITVNAQPGIPPLKVSDTFILLCGTTVQYIYITSSFRTLSCHSSCLP